jgi:hypothetical protein
MKYFNALKQNDDLVEALYEIPASFFFVLFYFLFIEHALSGDSIPVLMLRSALFILFYFLVLWFFYSRATVHILPVVSFMHSLSKENFSEFIYRVPGQLLGAFLATVVHLAGIKYGPDADFSIQVEPVHPFLTGLFTGIISQIIYLLFYFFINRLKKGFVLRSLLFSIGLGIIFLIVFFIPNIIILNPFGIVFHYLLQGNPLTLGIIFIGGIVHILVPMIFIGGTHYFIKNIASYIK